MSAGLIALIVAGVIALWAILTYNRMRSQSNQIENAWSQIDVQLKRRYDLIPNLVETVKGYAAHERQTLESVTAARARGVEARGVEEQAQAENMITSALRQLFAVAEAYPDLKANENFQGLQQELSQTENQIAFARQYYNDIVLRYNNTIAVFPNVVIAGMFKFMPKTYFEIEEASSGPVKVEF
ncbi:MAG: LemA family protein [Actinomycetota bacterium]